MRKVSFLSILLGALLFTTQCNFFGETEHPVPDFEDMEGSSIYNYIEENDSINGVPVFTKFKQILDTTGVGSIVSAYNPYNNGYTLFLPNDQAVDDFIADNPNYATFEDLLGDSEYVRELAKIHVLSIAIDYNDFPFGSLPSQTLSEDILTVNILKVSEDSSTFIINNQAPISERNKELSNGFIHVVNKMIQPITYTAYGWLQDHQSDYSIFAEAVELTGFMDVLERNLKVDSFLNAVTLLLEPDTVFNQFGIHTLNDLLDTIEEVNTNYTEVSNLLNQFVGYHILDANRYTSDFEDNATNFTTYGTKPLNINGNELEIKINRRKYDFGFIIVAGDTIDLDFIGINYDASNIITQSGPIHIINRVMQPVEPTRATVTFEFWDEPLISQFRQEPGEYIIDDPDGLYNISWTGPDLIFVEDANTDITAWGDDYLMIDGDFSITYRIPKVVPGEYELRLQANAFNELNAVVEVYVDGKKVGGLADWTSGGSSNWPYQEFHIGDIEFNTYERHDVEIRSLIPGLFEWDYVQFEPITD
ncbi:fasciclin domain-containing protein [Bacteroidota bacterium]